MMSGLFSIDDNVQSLYMANWTHFQVFKYICFNSSDPAASIPVKFGATVIAEESPGKTHESWATVVGRRAGPRVAGSVSQRQRGRGNPARKPIIGVVGALFVPEELPTLLSFLYTNIPPVFKGTDSRLGIGFRVGPNADFQIQLELGPQTRTQALGPDADGSNKKRHVPKPEFQEIVVPIVKKKTPETPMEWLQTWKTSIGMLSEEEQDLKPGGQPKLDYDTVKHLQQLYKEHTSDLSAVRY